VAGRPTRIFHDLRRSGVRNLIRAGNSEHIAMKISGHKARSILDCYNIVSERDMKEAARRLVSTRRGRMTHYLHETLVAEEGLEPSRTVKYGRF